jgi:hypothetical protein
VSHAATIKSNNAQEYPYPLFVKIVNIIKIIIFATINKSKIIKIAIKWYSTAQSNNRQLYKKKIRIKYIEYK